MRFFLIYQVLTLISEMKKILIIISLAVLTTFANTPSAYAVVSASRSLTVNTDKINRQEKILANRKNLLSNYLEKSISRLNQLKTRIKGSKNFTSDSQTSLANTIDQDVADLNTQKDAVQSANSVSELKNIAVSLKDKIQQIKSDLRTQIYQTHKIKYEKIIENLQKHEDSVQKYLTSLQQKGHNTSAVENLLVQSKNELSLAQASLIQSTASISEASFLAFQSHIKAAVSLLRQAVNLLKNTK